MSQKDNPSIESELEKLDEMVAWFEGEEFALDEALARHEEAEKLAKHIEGRLASLKNEVNLLKKKFDQAD